ncbi:hypothetical protein [Sphingomonas sp. OTU376]|uniref:hypothetical protein n=1 Tax=Sphingomonas sp. OTU376 TaxID=3043863 RepID=UPI00313AE22A
MKRSTLPPPTDTVRRAGRTDFAQLVGKAAPGGANLPFTHLTDAYHMRGIVEAGALGPQPCRVFEEPLLYLFYGRPAYRVAAQVESNGLDAYWPICFVLKPKAVAAKRIYPFDSGAFHHGRFGSFCHHGMIREDFELEADPATPARLLSLFWPDARSYFDNRNPLEPVLDAFAFEAKSYGELIRAKGNAGFDERHSAVEIQTAEPLALAQNLLAVILPADFASEAITTTFHGLGALVLPFDTVTRNSAANMVGQIYDICRDLYSGKHGGDSFW